MRPDTSADGEPGDTLQYAFVIANNGSLPETFDLSYASSQGLAWTFHEDLSASGTVPPGSASITSTGPLAAGARYHVVARAIIPLVAQDQTSDLTTFRVQSSANPSNYNIASGWTTISVARMTLTKLASAPDPLSGTEIIYTITYENSGHGTAYDFAVTDPIPTNTVYVPQSASLDGVPKTDELDGDQVTLDGGLLNMRLGTIAPNRRGTIAFRVRIQ
jgi:uncharacterized repeat protein (TIGR01451 family)